MNHLNNLNSFAKTSCTVNEPSSNCAAKKPRRKDQEPYYQAHCLRRIKTHRSGLAIYMISEKNISAHNILRDGKTFDAISCVGCVALPVVVMEATAALMMIRQRQHFSSLFAFCRLIPFVRAKCICDAAHKIQHSPRFNVWCVRVHCACSLSGLKHNTHISLGSTVVLLRSQWMFFLQHGQLDGVSSRFNPEENTL